MSKLWFKCAGIRAVKTICQTAIAMIGTATVLGDVNWQMVISASILSGILSMLTSLAGLPEVEQKVEDEMIDYADDEIDYTDGEDEADEEDEVG